MTHIPKLAICGPGRCGKDTAAMWLGQHTTLRYRCGTSEYAADLVFARMTAMGYQYPSSKACWLDRHKHRSLWADIIGQHNSVDPVRLYRQCLAEQDILTGLRWHREQAACRGAGLVDAWIWIERPGVSDPTMEYTPHDCTLTILNTGTLADFYRRLEEFASALGILRTTGDCVTGKLTNPPAGSLSDG